MLLAIDTSTGTSVAVLDVTGAVLAERDDANPRGHAETIGTFIAEALAASGCAARDIDRVAVGTGPGPFTGLRVGIAAARVFAFARDAELLPVVSHDAAALGCDEPTLVTTDARRRERYWSALRPGDDGIPERIAGPAIARPEQLEPGEIETLLPGGGGYARIDAGLISAAQLGRLAIARDLASLPAAAPQPLYLRAPDVTVSAGPKRVTA